MTPENKPRLRALLDLFPFSSRVLIGTFALLTLPFWFLIFSLYVVGIVALEIIAGE